MAKFYTAVVTVFQKDGSLDHEGNKAVYENLIRSGSDGIVLMGSTGEFCSMSMEMAKELIDLAVASIGKRMRVIAGTSRMIPRESVELSRYALAAGADAVMLISPYYFKLSDASIENYYDQIVPEVPGDVYLYNFPGCTGYDLKPEIALSLRRKYSNIKGYKDTVKNFEHTRQLCLTMLKEYPDFEIYSGFDEFFVSNVLSGGCGCIGGLTNMAPELFVRWTKALNEGRWEEVKEIQKKVNRMMEMFDICTPFLTAVKHAMYLRGIISREYGCAPLALASEKEHERIVKLMKELDIL